MEKEKFGAAPESEGSQKQDTRIEDVEEAHVMALAGDHKETEAVRLEKLSDLASDAQEKFLAWVKEAPSRAGLNFGRYATNQPERERALAIESEYEKKYRAWKEKERILVSEIGEKILRIKNPSITPEEIQTHDLVQESVDRGFWPAEPWRWRGDYSPVDRTIASFTGERVKESAEKSRRDADDAELAAQAIHRHPEGPNHRG